MILGCHIYVHNLAITKYTILQVKITTLHAEIVLYNRFHSFYNVCHSLVYMRFRQVLLEDPKWPRKIEAVEKLHIITFSLVTIMLNKVRNTSIQNRI